MEVFSVQGPFAVPLEPHKRAKMVAKGLDALWEQVGKHRHDVGVYVFAVRAGKGYIHRWSICPIQRIAPTLEV